MMAKDWGIILTAWQLYIYHPRGWTFLLAACLMSWGQRGINNLAHDSIHRNLVSNKVEYTPSPEKKLVRQVNRC